MITDKEIDEEIGIWWAQPSDGRTVVYPGDTKQRASWAAMWNKYKKAHDEIKWEAMSKDEYKRAREAWVTTRIAQRRERAIKKINKRILAQQKAIMNSKPISNIPSQQTSTKPGSPAYVRANPKISSQTTLTGMSKKPLPTGYNSQLGFTFRGSTKNPSAKLNWRQWSYKYEEFNIPQPDGSLVPKPAILNDLDIEFLRLMDTYDRLMVLAYRGAHKSTAGTRYAKRMILDYGLTVVYGAGDVSLATDYAMAIRKEFMENKNILRDYGYIIDDNAKNTQKKMYWLSQRRTAARQPGFSLVTSPSASKGKSGIGGHPDLIIFDDIISEEVEGSPRIIKKIKRWFWKTVNPMMMGNTKMIIIGTMKDPDDIYNDIIEKRIFKIIKIRAIPVYPNSEQDTPWYDADVNKWFYILGPQGTWAGVANLKGGIVGFNGFRDERWNIPGRVQYHVDNDVNKPLDGNLMSMQEFLLIRHEMGVTYFEYEYQLNAIPVTKGYLKWDTINHWEWGDSGLPKPTDFMVNCHAFLDQAFGFSNRADYNCLGVMSGFKGNYYLTDLWVWQGGGVGKKIKMIQEMIKNYQHPIKNKTYISTIGVEADFMQTQDAQTIKAAIPDAPIYPIYQNKSKPRGKSGFEQLKVLYSLPDDINPSKRAKISRILNQLDVPIQMGRLFIRKGIAAKREWEMNQAFPYVKLFDTADTVGSLVETCRRRGGRKVRCRLR